MKTLKEKIAVMQACEDGDAIRRIPHDGDPSIEDQPVFDWVRNDYEVLGDLYVAFCRGGVIKLNHVFSSLDDASDACGANYGDYEIRRYTDYKVVSRG